MKQYKKAAAVLITVPIFFFVIISAWAEPTVDGEIVSLISTEEVAPVDAIETAEVAAAAGLDMVMDGSSLEAYEKSLEKVRESATETEYAGLTGAFEYLLIYDLGAKRDPEKLAARLDGKTGHEILARVKWSKPK